MIQFTYYSDVQLLSQLKEGSEPILKILRAEFILIPVHKYLDNVYYASYSNILRKSTKYSLL